MVVIHAVLAVQGLMKESGWRKWMALFLWLEFWLISGGGGMSPRPIVAQSWVGHSAVFAPGCEDWGIWTWGVQFRAHFKIHNEQLHLWLLTTSVHIFVVSMSCLQNYLELQLDLPPTAAVSCIYTCFRVPLRGHFNYLSVAESRYVIPLSSVHTCVV